MGGSLAHLPVILDVLPHVVHQDGVGGSLPGQEVVEAGVAVIEETDEGLVVFLPERDQLPGSLLHIKPRQLQPQQQGRGVTQWESSSVWRAKKINL